MECYAGDIARVAFEDEDGVGVRAFDFVELDGVVSSSCEVLLVGGDAEAVDLRVAVLKSALTDAGESFPEPTRPMLEPERQVEDARTGTRTGSYGRSQLEDGVSWFSGAM